MQWYTGGKVADMHLVYEICDGNGQALNEFIENLSERDSKHAPVCLLVYNKISAIMDD